MEVFEDFLQSVKLESMEKYKSMRTDCRCLEFFMKTNDILLNELPSVEVIDTYRKYLRQNYSASTVKHRFYTLRAFLRWCKDNNKIPKSSKTDFKDNIKINELPCISDDDYNKLLNYCSDIQYHDYYIHARAKLEVLMILVCGLKATSIQRLKLKDITEEYATNNLNLLIKRYRPAIDAYLFCRKEYLKGMKQTNDNYLFINRMGKQSNDVKSDFNIIKGKCKIDSEITISMVRNNFIKHCDKFMQSALATSDMFTITPEYLSKLTRDELLLKLPCKIGTHVFVVFNNKLTSGVIENFVVDKITMSATIAVNDVYLTSMILDEDYFLTLEDADRHFK
jgi:site-specific recombinase XerD